MGVAVYSQCGLRIRSEVEMALPIENGTGWDVDVRWGPALEDSLAVPPGEVIVSYAAEEFDWYTATWTGEHYVFRFRTCGEFIISADLDEIEVRPDESGRPDLLPILLAGTVLSFLLSLRGHTILHASAVTVGGAALAFVGQSGRGKSTMAALMCADGAELVTDDVLAVDPGPPVMCFGGAPELRLRESAAGIVAGASDDRIRVTADERTAFAPTVAPNRPLPLTAIVIPSPSRTATELEVTRLASADAVFELLEFPRVHGWTRPDVLSRDFAVITSLVNQLPILEIVIPWGPPFSPGIAPGIRRVVLDVAGGSTRNLPVGGAGIRVGI